MPKPKAVTDLVTEIYQTHNDLYYSYEPIKEMHVSGSVSGANGVNAVLAIGVFPQDVVKQKVSYLHGERHML